MLDILQNMVLNSFSVFCLSLALSFLLSAKSKLHDDVIHISAVFILVTVLLTVLYVIVNMVIWFTHLLFI